MNDIDWWKPLFFTLFKYICHTQSAYCKSHWFFQFIGNHVCRTYFSFAIRISLDCLAGLAVFFFFCHFCHVQIKEDFHFLPIDTRDFYMNITHAHSDKIYHMKCCFSFALNRMRELTQWWRWRVIHWDLFFNRISFSLIDLRKYSCIRMKLCRS